MIRDFNQEYAVLQTGYWRIEVDAAHPRFVSMRCDVEGLGNYCQEMFEPGLGGESIFETLEQSYSSRHASSESVVNIEGKALKILGIRLGDFAVINWEIKIEGDFGEILSIKVTREILHEVDAYIEIPFGFQCLREFSFWSHPSMRIAHDPTKEIKFDYSNKDEMHKRRVIGYHEACKMKQFFIHSSPSYPDFGLSIDSGFYHIEQHYGKHVIFGISSNDFSDGQIKLKKGKKTWSLELRAYRQGENAPVSFNSDNRLANKFVPVFFDSYLLSAISCDHEMFGNNPYRHAYAPSAIEYVLRGYLITDKRYWSKEQGDLDERWAKHIRRTLIEGRINIDRIAVLMDSGIWQDKCGSSTHEDRCYSISPLFVTACCYHLLKTGDMKFAKEIIDDIIALLGSLDKLDIDSDGLLENPIPGTDGSPASGYNDCLSIGHKDSYLNLVSYQAYTIVLSLLEALGEYEKADFYRKKAEKIKKAYNDQLWDEKKGRYLGWIDVEGNRHDFWFAYYNFFAISTGIADEKKAKCIMKNFLVHPNHHKIFAAGFNLEPIPSGKCDSLDSFGLWLNGGVLLGPTADELYSRAAIGGGECAWKMLNDLMKQWDKDNLSGTPMYDWCRPLPEISNFRLTFTGKNAYTWIDGNGATGAGTEPYLSDGGAILWSIYRGIIGINPDFQGITLLPHVPKELSNVKVSIRIMGKVITIKINGYGDSIIKIKKNNVIITTNRILWEDIEDGCFFEVFINHL